MSGLCDVVEVRRWVDRSDRLTESRGGSVAQSFSDAIAKQFPFVTSSFPVRMKSGFVSSHGGDLFERMPWEEATQMRRGPESETQSKKRRLA